ncbi:hypothetical protein D9M68_994490 [compost metagenome]
MGALELLQERQQRRHRRFRRAVVQAYAQATHVRVALQVEQAGGPRLFEEAGCQGRVGQAEARVDV